MCESYYWKPDQFESQITYCHFRFGINDDVASPFYEKSKQVSARAKFDLVQPQHLTRERVISIPYLLIPSSIEAVFAVVNFRRRRENYETLQGQDTRGLRRFLAVNLLRSQWKLLLASFGGQRPRFAFRHRKTYRKANQTVVEYGKLFLWQSWIWQE